MILPSKDSPVVQRPGSDQNIDAFKTAVNNPTGTGDKNKKNSKFIRNIVHVLSLN